MCVRLIRRMDDSMSMELSCSIGRAALAGPTRDGDATSRARETRLRACAGSAQRLRLSAGRSVQRPPTVRSRVSERGASHSQSACAAPAALAPQEEHQSWEMSFVVNHTPHSVDSAQTPLCSLSLQGPNQPGIIARARRRRHLLARSRRLHRSCCAVPRWSRRAGCSRPRAASSAKRARPS